MRDFAEAEVIIPDGPFEGRRFNCKRQPYAGLWFDQVDSGRWSRCVATGPTQSGKTLSCFIIPVLYHLFEIGETVICGVPSMDMAADKWREDLLPAITRSRFREYLPTRGGGSRGGKVDTIQFTNGATLKFMTGGGGDKSRAGFSARVVVITETDGMDTPGGTSREADKITQLEARTRAYGSRKQVYLECTVSTETGRTWREYVEGSRSRIVLPCPHCGSYVTPERENLVGWNGEATKQGAIDAGRFQCPQCKADWTEADRRAANLAGRVIHDGQTIDADGTIHGDPPRTDTLGFRWSSVNNLFVAAGDLAGDEWRASRAVDEDIAEREMRQFLWAIPVAPQTEATSEVVAHEITTRTLPIGRGFAPKTAERITIGCDLGKYLNHWVAVAWSPGATGHVVDYGRIEVATPDLGVEAATLQALHVLRDLADSGWIIGPDEGERHAADLVVVDAGYQTPVVYAFCREAGSRFRPAVGRSSTQAPTHYRGGPKTTGAVVSKIGEGYHLARLRTERLELVEVDADHWKTWTHSRLVQPVDLPGAMTLYRAPPNDHLAFAKHVTAERKVDEFLPSRGVVTRWERVRKNNHWFDALYNACVAGHLAGVRLVETKSKPRRRRTLAELRRDAQRNEVRK